MYLKQGTYQYALDLCIKPKNVKCILPCCVNKRKYVTSINYWQKSHGGKK
uniref:Uncharacterized protein n=1 Tax=Anguilla anguilla TaxID=7936 RepID=A0A0E9P7K9_ANGAN